MKKILIPVLLLVLGYTVKAQTTNDASAMKESEKAALARQVGDPLVNGKPYSQYKAEQDALKQLREAPAQRVTLANPDKNVVSVKQDIPARITQPATTLPT